MASEAGVVVWIAAFGDGAGEPVDKLLAVGLDEVVMRVALDVCICCIR